MDKQENKERKEVNDMLLNEPSPRTKRMNALEDMFKADLVLLIMDREDKLEDLEIEIALLKTEVSDLKEHNNSLEADLFAADYGGPQ